jgi:hypothetical protein
MVQGKGKVILIDDGNNENNTNSIDIMTITITTVMAMVIIRVIQYLFVCMLTQQLNGQVQNRQEYTKNDVNTYKQKNQT